MTVVLGVNHTFVSSVPDDANATFVRPSNWNAAHSITGVDGINTELAGKAASTLTLTAGAGLTGGGDLSANRTFAVGAGAGVAVNADDVALDTAHARNVDHSGVTITAGAGLTGGGDISTTRTLDVGAGNGISVATDSVAVNLGYGFVWTVSHTFQAGLVATEMASPSNPAANNLHVFAKDVAAATHLFTRDSAGTEVDLSLVASAVPTSRTVTAGAGLTGGGNLTADRTLDVIGSTSIIVSADDVQRAALTGDVTAAQNVNGTTIANDVVTFAKMQNLTTDRLIGRDTALAGDPEEISVGGGLEFTGSAGIQRSALTGDVTATAGNNGTTIAAGVVTYAKMQDVSATARVIGRKTAAAGDPEECTLSEVLDFVGSAAQGDIMYRGATTWTRLGAGTAGFVLQSGGPAANPSWAASSGGTPTSRILTAGAGLTGGGDLTADRTFTVGAGAGITVNADDVALDTAHARCVDHSAVTLTAGAGMTGGGTIAANRTFDVIGSTSIIVGTDDVQRAALTGDVTAAQNVNATVIANDAVTYAKMQNVSATARVLGRKTAAAGDTEECTLSEVLDFIGSAAQGDILYRGASGWAKLAASTAGFVLQTGGAAANPSWVAQSGGAPTSRILTAGSGLTGGGDLTADRTFTVGAGTGITVGADDVGLDTAHARCVDHSAVTLTAGAGMTGGGTIAANRTFDVIGSTSIIVGTDDVQRAALTGDVTAAQNVNATTIAADAVSYAKMQNVSAASKLLGRGDSGSGDVQELTLGTGLTMSGTTVNGAAAGGMVLIQSQLAASSAQLDFETGLDDTYDHYEFRFSNIIPATNDTNLWVRFRVSGAYATGNYTYIATVGGGSTHSAAGSQGAGAVFLTPSGAGLGIANTGGNSASGVLTMHNPEAATKAVFTFQTVWNAQTDGFVRTFIGACGYNVAGAITGVRFMMSSGNITSGRVSLYGYKKS